MPSVMRRIAPLREASPLVLAGARAAFLTSEGVTLRALDSGETRTLPIKDGRGLGVLADDSVVVVSADGPTVIRIPPSGESRSHAGMIVLRRSRAHVLPLSEPGAFLCGSPREHVWHHRFEDDGELELVGWIDVDRNGHDTLAAGPEDSITYALAGEIVRRHLDKREDRYPMPGMLACHLAPGPRPELVWMTTSERVLHLVRLAHPVELVASFPLDGTPVHLAASKTSAAVIIGWDDAVVPFDVAVFDAEGERWSAPIAERDPYQQIFVACSPAHVVVLGKRLEAWTRDGQPIELSGR